MAGGTALGQGLVVLAAPLLTRLYDPDDFGLLAVYIALLSFLVTIASWRYEIAIPLAEDEATVARLVALCFALLVGTTLGVGVGVWLVGGAVAAFANAPGLASYLWLLPFSFLAGGAYQVLVNVAIRDGVFVDLAKTRLRQSVGQVATQLILGLAQVGPVALLLGDAVGRGGGSGSLGRSAWQKRRAELRGVSLDGLRAVAARYRRFPLVSSGSALINSAALQLPPLVLAAFYNTQVVGWVSLGQRVLALPLALIATSVGQVYFSKASRAARADLRQVRRLFLTTTAALAAVGLSIFVVGVLPAPWLFPAVFGHQWTEAGRYVQVLGIMFLIQFVSSPIGNTLDILERQDLHLYRELIRIGMMSGALLYGGLAGLKPFATITLFSFSGSIGYLIALAMVWHAIGVARRQEETGGR